MARSLRSAPVHSFESTGAPVGMTRGCEMTLMLDARCRMLPPSLFYFAGGYVETSYGGQAMLDADADAGETGCLGQNGC